MSSGREVAGQVGENLELGASIFGMSRRRHGALTWLSPSRESQGPGDIPSPWRGGRLGGMGSDARIAARRTYGRVDEHDGEYVETEFRDWLRIPLVPVRSFWIADDRGSQRTGFPIRIQPRSVAATYLRIWAPGIATAVLIVGSSWLAIAVAAALFGLSAWSWTWWPRDAALRRRSDFDLAAFGSRCDPARMTDEMHQSLANQLALRARADADPRPPDDVVRFGPRTADEALFAYGSLRLTEARDPRPQRAPDRFYGGGG